MKLKIIAYLLCALLFINANAQRVSPDVIKTAKGNLTIQPIQHATLVLTLDNKTVYVDPTGGAASFINLSTPDVIIVTDIHGDHFDTATIKAVKNGSTIIVVPQAVADLIPAADKTNLLILKNGEKTEKAGFSITAIPMYNLPEAPDSKHTKGRGNGYIISFGGKNIYISGDTEDIPEMRSLQNIDVAFVCMNLPYTMDINQAASAVLEFKPKIVYPYHYRGQDGLSDVNGFKSLVDAGNKGIEVRLRNWYAKQ